MNKMAARAKKKTKFFFFKINDNSILTFWIIVIKLHMNVAGWLSTKFAKCSAPMIKITTRAEKKKNIQMTKNR